MAFHRDSRCSGNFTGLVGRKPRSMVLNSGCKWELHVAIFLNRGAKLSPLEISIPVVPFKPWLCHSSLGPLGTCFLICRTWIKIITFLISHRRDCLIVPIKEIKHYKFSVNWKMQVKILGYCCPALFYSFLLHFIFTSKHSLPLPSTLDPRV